MKTISLLGTGWLGLPLAKKLLALGYKVKGSTTSHNRLEELEQNGINPYQLELESIAQHIAETGKASETLASFLETDILIINMPGKNIEAFNRLAQAVADSSVNKLIFVSSTSVYPQKEGWVTEQSETAQTHPLAQIEQRFREIESVETTVVRMAGLVGGRRHPGSFFKSGRIVKLAKAPVNLIHLDDCVGIMCAIIEQNAWGEIFNAAADTHPTKEAFYTHTTALVGMPTPQFEDTGERAKQVDNQKVKTQLSYTLVHPDLMKIVF